MTDSSGRASRAMQIVRFYTRARKVPSLIGKMPDGTRIPGGPYTTIQVIAAIGSLALLHQTRELWGFAGGITNLVLEVVIAAGIGFVIGHFETGIRNPVVIALGAASGVARPRHGTSSGRPVRPVPTRRLAGRVIVQMPGHPSGATSQPGNPSAAAPGRADTRRARPRSARAPATHHEPPPPVDATPPRPAARPRTGVEELLASISADQGDRP